MSAPPLPPLLGIAALALAAAASAPSLAEAWRHDPQAGPVAALAALAWGARLAVAASARPRGAHPAWWAAGLLLALGGRLGELHVLLHAGLATLAVALVPPRLRPAGLVAAAAWMPATGWAGGALGLPLPPAALRLLALAVLLLPLLAAPRPDARPSP